MTAAQSQVRSEEALEAFNRGDWETFRSNHTPDATYEEVPIGLRVEGIDAYVAVCQQWREAFPDLTGRRTRVLQQDGMLVEEFTWEGTHQGPLAMPDGQSVPPTGRRIVSHSVMWSVLSDDGRVRETRHYNDPLPLLMQLGVLPGA